MTVTRVLHAPRNPAGQATAFRDCLRELGLRSDVLTFERSPFAYADDYCLDLSGIQGGRRKHWRRIKAAARGALRYDVLHFHGGRSILMGASDLPKFRRLGSKMLMTYWGTDARLYSMADARNPYFDLMDFDPKSESAVRMGMERMGRFMPLATVPDMELREHVAEFFARVEVVPVIVQTKGVVPRFPEEHDEPLIVHAPSRRNVKGTRFVLEAIEELRRRRVRHRFRLVERVSNVEAKEVLATADVVVDQLLLGICGLSGLEAMALGKPVVTYLREDLRGMYGDDFPAIPATKETLADVLEELLSDLPRRRELGIAGRRYVERYRSPEVVGAKLLELYATL